MRKRAPGSTEGCTSNEQTQAIFFLRDRLTSRFALWQGVTLVLSGIGTCLKVGGPELPFLSFAEGAVPLPLV